MELRARPFLLPIGLLLAAAAFAAAAQSAAEATPGSVDAQLSERIRASVSGAVALPGGTQARIELEVGKLDPRLRLAPCKRIETVLPPAAQLWGKSRIGLRCAEGEKAWQVYLPVVVRVFAPALVPSRNLAAGTVLSAEMLQMQEVDWAADSSPPFAAAAPIVGRSVSRAVTAGNALRAADLRQRQWFAAGDTVVLWARGNGFVVSGEGQALSNGVEGQTVRVRTESGRVLTGMAVADRRVEVLL